MIEEMGAFASEVKNEHGQERKQELATPTGNMTSFFSLVSKAVRNQDAEWYQYDWKK